MEWVEGTCTGIFICLSVNKKRPAEITQVIIYITNSSKDDKLL